MTDTIPDDVDTRVAIRCATQDITAARKISASRLYDAERGALAYAGHLALRGGSLAHVRSAAMQVALIRDAQPTRAEVDAKRAALDEYQAVAA